MQCSETVSIRPGRQSDFSWLQQIEFSAFETLRSVGAVSGLPEASSTEELQQFLDSDLLLVAEVDGQQVAYVGGYCIEGDGYIGEVDVHPQWQQRGIGRALIMALLEAFRERGVVAASLTTDRFAPFNAPFYASLGFSIVEGADCPAYLAAYIENQITKGLDPARRVAMRLTFS